MATGVMESRGNHYSNTGEINEERIGLVTHLQTWGDHFSNIGIVETREDRRSNIREDQFGFVRGDERIEIENTFGREKWETMVASLTNQPIIDSNQCSSPKSATMVGWRL